MTDGIDGEHRPTAEGTPNDPETSTAMNINFTLATTVIDERDDLRYLPDYVMGAVTELAAGHAGPGQQGYLAGAVVSDEFDRTAVDLTALQSATRGDHRKTALAAIIIALLHAHGEGRGLPEPNGTDIIRALTYGYDGGNSGALLRAMALLIYNGDEGYQHVSLGLLQQAQA